MLITGAAGVIGRPLSLELAKQGVELVLLGRRVSALEKLYDEIEAAGGPTPAIYPLNLEGATPQDFATLGDTLERELGTLDALVHLAARFEGLSPLANFDATEWMRVMQIGLNAPLMLTQALLPMLQKAPRGMIVFTDDNAQRIERAYWGAYAVAKGAQRTLIKLWADELENTSVRVQTVEPGPHAPGLSSRAWAVDTRTDLVSIDSIVAQYVAALS
jgi:NAD(P)-dependent dehydrogenase (short-subunit alcohol dehydrogenase family)